MATSDQTPTPTQPPTPLAENPVEPTPILDRMNAALDDLSPQMRQAATYLLENPSEIAVTSMRGIADAAGVKPNTLVRMAKALGFAGYEELREPFRQQAAETNLSFPDRARFLRSIDEGGRYGALLADMAKAALGNVEALFADVAADDLKKAAELIGGSRRTHVLGVGTARPLAENFAYVAGMAVDNISAIPSLGLAIDDVARMGPEDVLLAMTFSPFRSETVEAVRRADAEGATIIAITDSWAAPIVAPATMTFIVPDDSPLPFSSGIAAVALLESLLAFVMADARTDVVTAIDTFHSNRRDAGIYTDD
ncbi:MAG: MurR/RpiR family transcriptional regulator [Actinomycetota bacterium]